MIFLEQCFDNLKVFVEVGDDLNCAAGFEGAEEVPDVFGAKKASFVMAFLGPGVGEIDVVAVDGAIGDVFSDEADGVGPDEPDVGEAPPADAVHGVPVVFSCPFDAEEIKLWVGSGLAQKEGSLTRADFDVYGRGTSEKVFEINFALNGFRGK